MCVDTHWSDGFLKCLVRMNCFDFPRDELRVILLERAFENWFSFRNGMDFIKPMKQLKHFKSKSFMLLHLKILTMFHQFFLEFLTFLPEDFYLVGRC